jgi:Domain of unknown function (DUF6438)
MQLRLSVAIVSFLSMFALPTVCDGECGVGKTPTYADISAVRYARTSCFGRCPDYQVLFAKISTHDPKFICEYVARSNVSKHGTYAAVCRSEVLSKVVSLLETSGFYSLSVVPDLVSDVPHLLIAVERCDVTTVLNWPEYPQRPDIDGLAKGLDRITDAQTWSKTSDSSESSWIQASF